jgi:hypothetical protein
LWTVACQLFIAPLAHSPNSINFDTFAQTPQWHQFCNKIDHDEEDPSMKTFTRRLLMPAAALSLLLLPGCYTQLGSVHDDRQYAYEQKDENIPEDTVSTEDYNNARDQFYEDSYDYYYPQTSLTIGFGSPWYWRSRSWYYADPYWADPFGGWCGTGYYNRGYYDYWGYPGYGYLPFSGYGSSRRHGGGYVTRDGGQYGSTRSFGSTRSSGNVRGGSAGAYAPATPRSGSSGTMSLPTGRVNTGARGGSSVDRGNTRNSSGRDGSVQREAPRSAPRPASGSRSERRGERYVVPPSSGGNSGSGSSSSGREGDRGSVRQSSPPPSSPPPSAPPPSGNSGGSAPTNTGERGGNKR